MLQDILFAMGEFQLPTMVTYCGTKLWPISISGNDVTFDTTCIAQPTGLQWFVWFKHGSLNSEARFVQQLNAHFIYLCVKITCPILQYWPHQSIHDYFYHLTQIDPSEMDNLLMNQANPTVTMAAHCHIADNGSPLSYSKKLFDDIIE